jgi:3'(2'), 5'-bisphosphate nucleotidase
VEGRVEGRGFSVFLPQMNCMHDQDLISSLKSIARAAGQKILEIYERKEGWEVEAKADNSPLTRADREANTVICEGLEKLATQYPIISEENKAIPYGTRKDYYRFWLVDPLDGTKEFIKRNGEFTVNIALIEAGQPILGIVYVPVVDQLYYGGKDMGAFREDAGGTIKLNGSQFSMNDAGLKVVASRSHINEATQTFLNDLNEPEIVSKGSSLKFMLLAEGSAQVYPRIAPTMEWDTGAAQAILEAAGGCVKRYDNLEPLRYNKENLLNPFFVAYAKTV